jgi:hypothetical protein
VVDQFGLVAVNHPLDPRESRTSRPWTARVRAIHRSSPADPPPRPA